MLAAMRDGDVFGGQPAPVRFLFAVRWKLGALFGWDEPGAGLGDRVRSLRERMPEELLATTEPVATEPAPSAPAAATEPAAKGATAGPATAPAAPLPDTGPFTPLYLLPDECALELANGTVHSVMHLGWAPAAEGGHELRMAVLVKPNGRLGRLSMALIAPFRHLLVYPSLTRRTERAWRDRDVLRPKPPKRG